MRVTSAATTMASPTSFALAIRTLPRRSRKSVLPRRRRIALAVNIGTTRPTSASASMVMSTATTSASAHFFLNLTAPTVKRATAPRIRRLGTNMVRFTFQCERVTMLTKTRPDEGHLPRQWPQHSFLLRTCQGQGLLRQELSLLDLVSRVRPEDLGRWGHWGRRRR